MPSRFLNNININDEYSLPSADGSADQIITTDGAGQLSFVDQSTLNSGSAERTEILVKNLEGSALSKGDPVYIVGSVGASDRLEVALADASDAAKMPCVGLLTQDLANNGEGTATVTGKLRNLITSPIDGATPTENDTIYVKSGGGLTLTKPTGSTNLIQNVGQVGRVSTSADGNIVVSAILRSNDIPNLPTGKIWVGDGNTTVSDVVYLDEVNGRMGIGTTSPATKLHISDATTPEVRIQDTTNNRYLSLYQNNSNSYIQSSLNSALVFSTHGANERMRITTAGNVGIGTTSPGSKLTVFGDIMLRNPNGANPTDAGSFIFNESGTTWGTDIYGFRFNLNGSSNVLTLQSANTTTVNDIISFTRDSASVGIGTTSPSQKLHVSGNARVTGAYYDSNNLPGTSGQVLSSTATGTDWVSLSEISGVDGTGTTNYVAKWSDTDTITDSVIYDDGTNVGIGTTNPLELFHVHQGNSGGSANIAADEILVEGDGDTGITISSPSSNIGTLAFGDESVSLRGALRYDHSDDSMSFRVSSAEKMRITSAGNVGIGTTSPTNKLDVNGITTSKGFQTNTTNTNYNLISRNSAGNATLYVQSATSNTNQAIAHFNYGSATANAGIQVLKVAKDISYFTNTNLGIGTTSPSYKLDVSGDAYIDETLNIETTISGTLQYGYGGVGAGNLVVGGLNFASFTPGVITLINQDTTISAGQDLGVLQFGGKDDTTNGYANGQIICTTASNAGTGNSGGGIFRFLLSGNTTGSGLSEKMRITNTGNVGIGTTDPGTKLDVVASTTGKTWADYAGTVGTFERNGDSNINIISSNTGVGGVWFGDTDSMVRGRIRYEHASDRMELWTNNSEKVSITSTGNVGIGTTTPTAPLHIEGGTNSEVLKIEADANPYARWVQNGTNVGFLQFSSTNAYLSNESNGSFFFRTNSTDKMTITTGGNVGIGTTAPGAKLEVNGNTRIVGGLQLYQGSTSNQYLTFSQTFGSTFINTGTSGETIFIGAPTAYQSNLQLQGDFIVRGGSSSTSIQTKTPLNVITNKIVDSGISYFNAGNVGIGTTSPSYKLDVNGVIRGEQYLRLADTGGTNQFSIRAESTYGTLDNGSKTFNYVASNHSFLVGSFEIMRINSSGNVGIGTTSPSEKLEVNGTVKASATTDAYKGYIKQNVNSYGAEKVENSNYYFTSYNTTSTVTSAQAYNRTVAAYSGRVKKVYIRHGGGLTPTATAVNFKKHTNGTTSSTVYSATVANAAGANMSAYYEFGNNDFTFNAGDLIGLLYQTTDAFGTASKTMGQVAVTIILEYNIT